MLHPLFNSNKKLKIFFLANAKDVFDQNIDLEYTNAESNKYFEEEIQYFNRQFNFLNKTNDIFTKETWLILQTCISGYLLKYAYSKLNKDRNLDCNQITPKIIKKDEYFELRTIYSTQNCEINLVYHIENEELLVIKQIEYNGEENPYLLKKRNRKFKQNQSSIFTNILWNN